MTTTKQPNKIQKGGALAACVGLACASILTALIPQVESGGKQYLKPYQDIVGVWTVCDGDTQGVTAATRETPEGCAIRLDTRLVQFAQPVLQCTPNLKGHAPQLAAAISLAYNIGAKAYCSSTVDRKFDARHWNEACGAFAMWNKAGGKVVPGLVNRRAQETTLCRRDLPTT